MKTWAQMKITTLDFSFEQERNCIQYSFSEVLENLFGFPKSLFRASRNLLQVDSFLLLSKT